MSDLRCGRGHRLVRFEPVGCEGHGEHRVYVCPMWSGRRRCGHMVVVPPWSGACDRDEERDGA